ncbi:hypothetical protein ACJX0J_030681, partial [Zea mays]
SKNSIHNVIIFSQIFESITSEAFCNKHGHTLILALGNVQLHTQILRNVEQHF